MIAWTGRCCLEFYIWINYCHIDDIHVRRFYEEALKHQKAHSNAFELIWEIPKIGERATELSPINKQTVADDDNLSGLASFIGLASADERPRAVYQAAIELGCEIQFRTFNTIFSERTHIGPHSIVWPYNETAHKDMCNILMHLATTHALTCYDLLLAFCDQEQKRT